MQNLALAMLKFHNYNYIKFVANFNQIKNLNTLDFSILKEVLLERKKILITSHTNPDGDAIGSSLGLYHFLKLSKYEVTVVLPTAYPDFLDWMPAQEEIVIYEKEKEKADQLFQKADIIFSLDYNSSSRLGIATEALQKASAIKILVDHHLHPKTEEYDHVFSTTETTSTSELVFDLIWQLNPSLLNKEMAACLYTGIMTDTGSFSYACNYEKTFRVVAELYKAGIDGVQINRLVYNNYSENRLRLLGFSISQKLKVIPALCTAYISLTKTELDHYHHKTGDTEGLVNYALSIKGIHFAALLTERDNKIRISFRSVGDFSVNEFAKKHFEGGGHRNAAGGDSYLPMNKTLEKFESLLLEYKNELSSK
jgi:phosphoesterase RecJ-like protein